MFGGKAATLRRYGRLTALALVLGTLPVSVLSPWGAEAQPRTKQQTQKSDSQASKSGKSQNAKSQAAKPRVQKNPEPARQAAEARGDGFRIADRWVRMDVVKADPNLMGSDGKAPAVLILHGSRGLGDGSLFYPQARALADRGISAFVVHYFDGLSEGSKAAPALHDRRERIISEAISQISNRKDVDAERIGVFGLSLGGFHALSLGSRDERVQAVVNVFGAMPAEVERKGVDRMPPTLVLHGDKDRVVPVRKAHELESLLKEVGAEHEVKIYQGQGHVFRGDAKEDSITRTTDFFERYLGIDKMLLDKPIQLDFVLAPVVPKNDLLPIRPYYTLGDEASLTERAALPEQASPEQVVERMPETVSEPEAVDPASALN